MLKVALVLQVLLLLVFGMGGRKEGEEGSPASALERAQRPGQPVGELPHHRYHHRRHHHHPDVIIVKEVSLPRRDSVERLLPEHVAEGRGPGNRHPRRDKPGHGRPLPRGRLPG